MTLFSRLFGRSNSARTTPHLDLRAGIPTVKFDPRRVTEEVKADLHASIEALPEIENRHREIVYQAAFKSISAGRDLHVLSSALLALGSDTITKGRAASIAMMLNNRATVIMDRQRMQSLGITDAVWLHSGVPCCEDPKRITPGEMARDRAHRAVSGQRYDVSKGMVVDGNQTWPGFDPGCRCCSKSMIKGFS
jgi:hypothetical protein